MELFKERGIRQGADQTTVDFQGIYSSKTKARPFVLTRYRIIIKIIIKISTLIGGRKCPFPFTCVLIM